MWKATTLVGSLVLTPTLFAMDGCWQWMVSQLKWISEKQDELQIPTAAPWMTCIKSGHGFQPEHETVKTVDRSIQVSVLLAVETNIWASQQFKPQATCSESQACSPNRYPKPFL